MHFQTNLPPLEPASPMNNLVAATVLVSLLLPVIAVISDDRRHYRGRRKTFFSHRGDLKIWREIDNSQDYEGWFRRKFRCSKRVFDVLCSKVERRWISINEARPAVNAVFKIRDRFAITMYYLTHPVSVEEAGAKFGASKTRAHAYIGQVVAVLISYFHSTISLPKNESEWLDVCEGFEQVAGFPRVCGAVDGCLFPIQRPEDFEGWYCRKGFKPLVGIQIGYLTCCLNLVKFVTT
jgi:hypothetical protein